MLDLILRRLDRTFFRFGEAFRSFRNPDRVNESFNNGKEWGEAIAFAKVSRALREYDPQAIDNQHFKMGYYYAKGQAKAVMSFGEDNALA